MSVERSYLDESQPVSPVRPEEGRVESESGGGVGEEAVEGVGEGVRVRGSQSASLHVHTVVAVRRR